MADTLTTTIPPLRQEGEGGGEGGGERRDHENSPSVGAFSGSASHGGGNFCNGRARS